MCEGGVELRKYGEIGRLLVDIGGELLGERRKAGLDRGMGGNCRGKLDGYREVPYHYRYPGVSGQDRVYRQDYLLHVMRTYFNENSTNK